MRRLLHHTFRQYCLRYFRRHCCTSFVSLPPPSLRPCPSPPSLPRLRCRRSRPLITNSRVARSSICANLDWVGCGCVLGQHTHTVGLNSRPFWVQSCQVECLIGPVERIPFVVLVGFIRTTSVRLSPSLASVTAMPPLNSAFVATCHHHLHLVGHSAFAARLWSVSSHISLYFFASHLVSTQSFTPWT